MYTSFGNQFAACVQAHQALKLHTSHAKWCSQTTMGQTHHFSTRLLHTSGNSWGERIAGT